MTIHLQTIINDHLGSIGKLTQQQRTALYNISTCRTSQRGYFAYDCNNCHEKVFYFKSCGSRYCPKCSALKNEKWLLEREEEILPVTYLFITFTLPPRLWKIFSFNEKLCYSLFFKVCYQSLKQVVDYNIERGANIGGMAALHTWKQDGSYFPHVHFLMPWAYLSEDQSEWVRLKNKYVFPYKSLKILYKSLLIDRLVKLFKKDKLKLPQSLRPFESDQTFKRYLYGNDEWCVNVKSTKLSPEYAYEYISRYVNKTALSEERIENYDGKNITLRVKNRETERLESISMDCLTFIKRFIRHILPKGFTRIRYFGFLSCRKKQLSLALIRDFLIQPIPAIKTETLEKRFCQQIERLGAKPWDCCKSCHTGRLILIYEVTPRRFDHPLYLDHPG